MHRMNELVHVLEDLVALLAPCGVVVAFVVDDQGRVVLECDLLDPVCGV